jgi:hypothetical protein
VTQQVNLYSDILKQQQKQSGSQLTMAVFGLCSLLCAGFSAYLLWNNNAIEAELQHAQLTFNQEQARVNALLSKRPSQELNISLLTDIEQWQNSISEASQMLQLLAGRESELSQGFSGYLLALANQSNPDIWLTAIHIDGQNKEMNIEGSTFKAEQIPLALQQLQQEAAFKGHTFAKLNMQQSAKIVGQMDFTLSSSEQPVTVKDHAQ